MKLVFFLSIYLFSDPALRYPLEHLDHVGADGDDIRPPAAQLLRMLVGQHDPRQADQLTRAWGIVPNQT